MSLPHHVRRPDIEGLRALAVALVVSEHVFGAPRGGFIGVDVFFVISGYLIVGLLLREHERTARIDLVAFAERRFRRLAPAAVVVMGATLVVTALVFPAGRFTGVAEDAGWATVMLANWHFAAQQTDYFAADAPQSPLQHLWSLSVEEQFYVVIPLVLAALLALGGRARRRRLATALFLTIAVTSFGWAWFDAANDPSGAYFSTASRAWELAVGGVLASSVRHTPGAERTGPRPLFLRPTALAAIGWAGLAGIAAATALLDGDVGFPAPYGALAVAGTVLVIVSGGRDGHTAPLVLRLRPAIWLGAISYSLYLWHFPVLVVIRTVSPEDVWLTIPVSLVFAVVTYQLVERTSATIPIRYGHTPRRSEWRAWGERVRGAWRRTGVLALASCVGVLFLFLADDRTTTPDDGVTALDPVAQAPSDPHQSGGPDATPDRADPADPSAASVARTESIRRALTSTKWPETRPTIDEVSAPKYLESLAKDSEWSETLRCASSWSADSLERCTFGDGDRTMMLVGDSTAGFLAPAFRAVVEQPDSNWRMVNATRFGCPWLDMAVAFDGSVDTCEEHKTTTTQLIREVRPDVVVVVNVASPTVDHPDEDRPITHAEWAGAVSAMAERVPSTRLLAVVPNPVGPDVRTCGGQPSGCVTSDSASRARAAALRTALGDTAVVDTSPAWCARGRCPAFIGSELVRVDTLHVHPAAGIAARDELRALMRAADVDL